MCFRLYMSVVCILIFVFKYSARTKFEEARFSHAEWFSSNIQNIRFSTSDKRERYTLLHIYFNHKASRCILHFICSFFFLVDSVSNRQLNFDRFLFSCTGIFLKCTHAKSELFSMAAVFNSNFSFNLIPIL